MCMGGEDDGTPEEWSPKLGPGFRDENTFGAVGRVGEMGRDEGHDLGGRCSPATGSWSVRHGGME